MQSEEPTTQENIFKPRKIVFPQSFQSNELKKVWFSLNLKIYANANRSYALFKEEVLSWGDSIFQTQDDETQNKKKHKNAIVIPIRVSQLALGAKHTFAYADQRQFQKQISVYCWGSNKNYELGLEEERQYGLQKVDIFDQAFQAGFILKEISCGESHTMVVFKDEQILETKLFGWGESKSYQLALDTTGIIPYPVQIDYEFTSQISKIYSKSDYNIAILNDGNLYSWGSNMFNRLGLNQTKKLPPTKFQLEIKKTQNSPNTSRESINLPKNFNNQQDISFTDRRALTAQNSSNSMLKVRIPRKIDIFGKKINHLALGTYHVIALTNQGQCFSWGNGIYGQLGNNKFGECFPQKISTKHLPSSILFVECSAGERHSCLLDNQGNVYTCGTNSYGVLGHQKHQNQQKNKRCKIFEKIDYFEQNNIKICFIASGDRHIMALSSEKELYSWGSNKQNQVIFDKEMINYAKDALSSKEIKQSRIRTRKNTKDEAIKFLEQNENEQMSESKLMTLKMKEHLYKMPEKQSQNTQVSSKLKDWKERFSEFLLQKRRQEDDFMQQLEQIIRESQK